MSARERGTPAMARLGRGVLLALVWTGMAHSPAWSDAVNGGFESGNFNGWTVEFTNVFLNPSNDKRTFGTWSTSLPSGHPGARVIDGTEDPIHVVGSIVPYCDGFMAKINDEFGKQHATRIRQTIPIGPTDVNCSAIKVRWGALLQVAQTHTDQEQAFFQIDVKVNGNVVETFAANANDATAANGWTCVSYPGDDSTFCYKPGAFTHTLHDLSVGDNVEVIMTVADCTESGHGGCAFIDCVALDAPCGRSCSPGISSVIPQPTLPNVFTPNGDGINDIWTISNIQQACSIHVEIFDRDGIRVFKADGDQQLGYAGGTWSGWNGKLDNTGADVPDGVYSFVVTGKNCVDSEAWTGFVHIFR